MSDKKVLRDFTSKNILYFKTLPSTQSYALDWISKNKPKDKTAILTYNQSQGKGQLGATWLSKPEKNIAVSYILCPEDLHIEDRFLLAKMSALVIREFLAALIPSKVMVKWPNDIVVNHKKLAGILINNTFQGNKLNCSVIGMGININQAVFPIEIPDASSVFHEIKIEQNLDELVLRLTDILDDYYLLLKSKQYLKIDELYLNHLFGYHSTFHFMLHGQMNQGEILDVNKDGKVLIKTNHSEIYYDLKEIKILL